MNETNTKNQLKLLKVYFNLKKIKRRKRLNAHQDKTANNILNTFLKGKNVKEMAKEKKVKPINRMCVEFLNKKSSTHTQTRPPIEHAHSYTHTHLHLYLSERTKKKVFWFIDA